MYMMHSSESKHAPGIMERIRRVSGARFSLSVLVGVHIVICCASLVQVAHQQQYMLYDAKLVNDRLSDLVKDVDLSKYIL